MSEHPPKGLTPKQREKHDRALKLAWDKMMRICPPVKHPPMPQNETRLLQCEALARTLGWSLLPHQKCMIASATEIQKEGKVGGRLRYTEVLIYFGRQSGKSATLIVLALDRLLVRKQSTVIWAAQQQSSAREQVEKEAWPKLQQYGFEDAQGVALTKGGSDPRLECAKTGSLIKLRSTQSNKGAARGGYADLLVMDEIYSLTDHQAEATLAPTTATRVKFGAQTLLASTSPFDKSVYLRFKLDLHEEEANKRNSDLAFWSWESPTEVNHLDPEIWRRHIPGFAFGLYDEKFLANASKTMPADEFKREYLSQRISTSDEGPFVPTSVWRKIESEESEIRQARGELWVGIDAEPYHAVANIVVADSTGVIEHAASKPGVDWIADWLEEWWVEGKFKGVAVMARGPLDGELEKIKNIASKYPYNHKGKMVVPVQEMNLASYSAACQSLRTAVCAGDVLAIHSAGEFERAVSESRCKVNQSGGFAVYRRTKNDECSALVAAILAYGAAMNEDWEGKKIEIEAAANASALATWNKLVEDDF